jgi:ribosome maturation factor RimP
VTRGLEEFLDQESGLEGRYLLEVSSPGVERPLVRSRDFERFAGQEVALRGNAPLAGRARRLEGELLGLVVEEGEERVRLRLSNGDEVDVPRAEIVRAHLVYRWDMG